MKLGEKITELRKIGGVTQEQQLAEKLHVSRQTVSKWENSFTEPDWSSVIKISEIFTVSLDELADNPTHDEIATEKIGFSLQDIMKINTHNRRMTMLLMISIELIVIGILSIIVIAVVNDATSTIQYMLYRYIVVTDYSNVLFADYGKAYIFAGISCGLGLLTSFVYFVKRNRN